ncbi:MAG TPA: methylthioribulose 1-phosphate dehydratase [Steroidobacteraceae bacterium]|nr:methylthioribulose 1-phosphate dehydratase [Steroidobacteraceae bacterium]
MYSSLDQAAQAIIAMGRRLDDRGLAAATSGNHSARLADGRIAITVSGRHKGRLTPQDVMVVDAEGRALAEQRPSAETLLHTLLYQQYPHVHAVLHVHSVAGTSLTRHLSEHGDIVLRGYEMLKAFPGISTHETAVRVPVFENSQDIPALAAGVTRRLQDRPPVPAFLIRAHGAYAWGKDLDEAERVLEALEYLLLCELEAARLGGSNR